MQRFRTTYRIAAIAVAGGLMLGACQQGGEKQSMGTLLGAAGGALAGSQVGKGRGTLVAVAVGTLLGGIMGSEVGKSLDRADRLAMENAQSSVMTAPVGQTITWSNPDSGNSGTVRTTREGTSNDGRYCREYQHTVQVGGKTQDAYGTACRQPDGSWQVVQN
jgi:surface antigen